MLYYINKTIFNKAFMTFTCYDYFTYRLLRNTQAYAILFESDSLMGQINLLAMQDDVALVSISQNRSC